MANWDVVLPLSLFGVVFAIAVYFRYKWEYAEMRRSEEHIKACTQPNYFKSREQVLEEEVARLQEENAKLSVKASRTEYR